MSAPVIPDKSMFELFDVNADSTEALKVKFISNAPEGVSNKGVKVCLWRFKKKDTFVFSISFIIALT